MPQGMPYGQFPQVQARKKKKTKLSSLLKFNRKAAPKKGAKPTRPSEQSSGDTSASGGSPAKGLALAAQALPGRGSAGRILKAGLAGAAAGAEIQHAFKKAGKKGMKATTTVSKSAMAQKAMFHKKEHGKMEKV